MIFCDECYVISHITSFHFEMTRTYFCHFERREKSHNLKNNFNGTVQLRLKDIKS